MATVVPPPSKRRRVAEAEKAREQQEIDTIPDDLGSIRVQFIDQATGQAAGAPVSIPVADATVKNLELLLNTLQSNVGVPPGTGYLPCRHMKYLITDSSRMRLSGYHTALHTVPADKIPPTPSIS